MCHLLQFLGTRIHDAPTHKSFLKTNTAMLYRTLHVVPVKSSSLLNCKHQLLTMELQQSKWPGLNLHSRTEATQSPLLSHLQFFLHLSG